MGALNPLFTMVRDYLLKFLPEEKKYSPNTIRSYRKALELLFDYVKEQKKINDSKRRDWNGLNPVTRVAGEEKKKYSRKVKHPERLDEE